MDGDETLRVLLVEDNPGDVRLIEEMLRDAEDLYGGMETSLGSTPELTHADMLADALEILRRGSIDVVLLDLGLPDSEGFETLDPVLDATDHQPIVVLTGMQDEQFGIRAVKRGAQDYLVKDEVTSTVLFRSIHHAIDRKEYERKLQQKNDELAILHRVVRHDIRDEMTLVLGQGESLLSRVDPDLRRDFEILLRSSKHVIELTRTVGDLVESITDADELALKPMNPANVLRNELEKARDTHPSAEFVVDGDLDATPVRANEMLPSVFGNILANAVRHNDKGTPQIEVSTERDGDEVVTSFADNGPGIPDEWKDEIFGRGEKGLESPGTGVGLYLVYKLVNRYGGRVWVTDNEPVGSIFRVALPVAEN